MNCSKGVKNAWFYASCVLVFYGCSGFGSEPPTPPGGQANRVTTEAEELDLDVLSSVPSTSTTVATTSTVPTTTTTVATTSVPSITTVVVVPTTARPTTTVVSTVPERDDHPLIVDTTTTTVIETVPDTDAPDAEERHGGVWDRLAECESGGDWQINTGNGYYGGLQFAKESWDAVGGSGYPHEHSREEQIHRAEILLDIQGWGAWPTCSRKLGLR